MHDYPVELSPFARPTDDDPTLTERFEYFAGGMELGNAFTEINEAAMQQARFDQQSEQVEGERGDPDYVEALSYGMPPTGGLGLRDRPLRDAPHRQGVDPRRRALPCAPPARGLTARRSPVRGTPDEGSSAAGRRAIPIAWPCARAVRTCGHRPPAVATGRRADRAIGAAHAAAAIAAALDALVTIDHRGRVLEFNLAAEQLFGYSPRGRARA